MDTVPTAAAGWSVIVLSGGGGTRMGGADKARLIVGGRTLLDTLLADVPEQVPVVVAGPPQECSVPVLFAPEEPVGGGPVAGIASALAYISTDLILVAAVDMPRAGALLPDLIARLRATNADVVVPVSSDGRRQVLLTAWRTPALRAAVDRLGEVRDRSVRDLVAGATAESWHLTVEESASVADIDTPGDLDRARTRTHDRTL